MNPKDIKKLIGKRKTKQERVLNVFLAAGSGSRFTESDICRIAEMPGGAIYPHLAYLEGKGWIVSGWKEKRRVYWLNPTAPYHLTHASKTDDHRL